MFRKSLGGLLCVVACGVGMAGSRVEACSVPVFRYALERWQPDPYVLLVFHEGPLSEAARSLVARIEGHSDTAVPANVEIVTVDVSRPIDEALQPLWEKERESAARAGRLPWAVFRFPFRSRLAPVLWSGPFEASAIDPLLTSPARLETARRLCAGDSVVWLLLEAADADRNAAFAEKLTTATQRLAKELKLPEILPGDERYISRKGPPLRIAFSVQRIRRDDPAEKVLVDILLNAQADDFKPGELDGPLAVPVFGRGRALAVLLEAETTPGLIGNAADFLTGPCSCEIKEQSPGFDLPLRFDWDAHLEGRFSVKETVPDLTGLAVAVAAPERSAVSAISRPDAPSSKSAPTASQVSSAASGANDGTAASIAPSDSRPQGLSNGEPAIDERDRSDSHVADEGNPLLRNVALVLSLGIAAAIVGSLLVGRRAG